MAAGACVIGLIFDAGRRAPAPRVTSSLVADLYLGRLANPQWLGGRVDAKMYLYLVGAVMLEANVASFTARHLALHAADPSPGVLLYAGLFTFFVAEYLNFERVHLYTYDSVRGARGVQAGLGVPRLLIRSLLRGPLVRRRAAQPAHPRPAPGRRRAPLLLRLGALAWSQPAEVLFKTEPHRRFLGWLHPVAIRTATSSSSPAGSGGSPVHVNYLGGIHLALGLALSLGYPGDVFPWLYPVYYVALLFPRQHSDDQRCAEKYGALWEEYCRRVPYRIIPWVYSSAPVAGSPHDEAGIEARRAGGAPSAGKLVRAPVPRRARGQLLRGRALQQRLRRRRRRAVAALLRAAPARGTEPHAGEVAPTGLQQRHPTKVPEKSGRSFTSAPQTWQISPKRGARVGATARRAGGAGTAGATCTTGGA